MAKGRRVDTRKEAKNGDIERLRKIIRRLESDKRKLLSEIKTLEKAFENNIRFLRGKTKDLSVEELIDASNKEMSLKDIEDSKKQTIESLTDKWRCHQCETGVLKLLIFSNRAGKFYFRICSNEKCRKRTKVQPYTDEVVGIQS